MVTAVRPVRCISRALSKTTFVILDVLRRNSCLPEVPASGIRGMYDYTWPVFQCLIFNQSGESGLVVTV
jgi:hypothetical protein